VPGTSSVAYVVPPELDFPLFQLFETNYPAYRMFMLAVSVFMFVLLFAMLTRTRVGLIVQAASYFRHRLLVGLVVVKLDVAAGPGGDGEHARGPHKNPELALVEQSLAPLAVVAHVSPLRYRCLPRQTSRISRRIRSALSITVSVEIRPFAAAIPSDLRPLDSLFSSPLFSCKPVITMFSSTGRMRIGPSSLSSVLGSDGDCPYRPGAYSPRDLRMARPISRAAGPLSMSSERSPSGLRPGAKFLLSTSRYHARAAVPAQVGQRHHPPSLPPRGPRRRSAVRVRLRNIRTMVERLSAEQQRQQNVRKRKLL